MPQKTGGSNPGQKNNGLMDFIKCFAPGYAVKAGTEKRSHGLDTLHPN